MRLISLLILSTLLAACSDDSSNSSDTPTNPTDGQGGSRARFTISGDQLFTLNNKELFVFDISRANDPLATTKVSAPANAETLFAYKDYLYIGTENGVLIYNQPTDSTGLTQVGTFTHAQSCDPVVVQDDIAYLTTRTGSSCRLQDGQNALQILDVSDPTNPQLTNNSEGAANLRTMVEPGGLGIDQDKLFICDGAGGLKTFTVNVAGTDQDGKKIVDISFDRDSSISDIDCFDVIPNNNTLIVSNNDEIRQYDYSTLPMTELGSIK